jgi:hypothetical protein
MGFGLVIKCIIYLQNVTTNNLDSHSNITVTMAHIKSSLAIAW